MAALALMYGADRQRTVSAERLIEALSSRAGKSFSLFYPDSKGECWGRTADLTQLHARPGPLIAWAPTFAFESGHCFSENQLLLCLDGRLYGADHRKITLPEMAERFNAKGPQAVSDCYGRWALLVADLSARSVYFFRDPAGIQPLYYAEGGDEFYAASECGALRKAKKERSLNPASVFKLLATGGKIDKTPVLTEGIQEMQGGHCLHFAWENGTLHSARMFPRSERYKYSEDAVHRKSVIREEIIRNTTNSLVDASSIVLGLSGGLDSNILAAVTANHPKRRALSSYFPGFERDEYKASLEAAEYHRLKTSPVLCNSEGLIHRYDSFVDVLDLPVVTGGTFLKFELFRHAKSLGALWLDGEGGDSLFAGLTEHQQIYALQALKEGSIADAWKRFGYLDHRGAYIAKGMLAAFPRFLQCAMARWIYPEWKYIRPDLLKHCRKKKTVFPPLQWDLQSALESKYFGSGMNYSLRCHDRISHHFSVPCAMPFVEYSPLTEWAMGLPNRSRIREGYGKWELREIFRDSLPPAVVDQRDKYGMEAPTNRWLSEQKEYFMDLLDSSRDDEFVDVPKLRADYATFYRPGEEAPFRAYTLLHFLAWRKINRI